MNSHLESSLLEIIEVIKPLEQDFVQRYNFINELQEVVQSVPSLRGSTVEPFGSFVSNLFTRWGDLDISIDLPAVSRASSAGKEHKLVLLEDLLYALRWKAGFSKLQYIPNARVPILKLECSQQGISCDISIDNPQGQIKSKVLFWLNKIDGRFREMVLLVKEWAKAHNINCPKNGSLNSYSLSMLVIFHFQTCVPAIFPPLRDIYPGNIVDDLRDFAADAEDQIRKLCASNIAKSRSDKSRIVNSSSLAELFISFIIKFSNINLRATEAAICPFTGTWETIRGNMRWLPQKFSIIVEDPFEQPQNTCRGVSSRNLMRVAEAFEKTRRVLAQGNQNKDVILEKLVRPRIARQILNRPISSHSSGGTYSVGGNLRVHQTVQQLFHSRLQQQNRYQNTRNPGVVRTEMDPIGLAPQSSTQRRAVRSESRPIGLALQAQPGVVIKSERHPNGLAPESSTQQYNYQGWQSRGRPRHG